MSFDEKEQSTYAGSPILLYEFHRSSGGEEFYWRYTNADRDFILSGDTYSAVAISDGGVRQSGEPTASDFVVTMPVTEDLPNMFRTSGSSPSDVVFLTVRRIHFGDTSALWSTDTVVSSGPGGTILASGVSLAPGESISSPSTEFTLIFQVDGNLVLLQEPGDLVLWASATEGLGADSAIMQADGNLVVYNGLDPLWASNTAENPGAYLVLQDDGNAVIYSIIPVETRVIWVGTLAGMTQPDEVQVKITCATLVASFRRGGLRLSYTRGCPHALYDPQCKIDPEDFKTVATVDSHTGNSITSTAVDALDDGWFDGGYLEWSLPSGIVERRGILTHVGDTITIMGTVFGIADSDSVNVFPGCLRTTSVCQTKFDNLANHGGFPHTPGKSPFSGDPVF